jgi:hypothetical protein
VYDPDLLAADAGRADRPPMEIDAGSTACPLAKAPVRPAGVDDGDDVGPLVFGLKDVILNQDGDRWRSTGYDLDNLCTLPGEDPDHECIPIAPTAAIQIDGMNGIDNAFGHEFYPIIQAAFPDLERISRESAEMGRGAVLVTIEGWNGEPNDSRVDVRMATTVDGSPSGGATLPPGVVLVADELHAGGKPLPPPVWDGDDWLWARADSYVMGDLERPRIRDDNAYVTNGTIVFHLPERATITFQGVEQALQASLTGAVVTARISPDRSRLDPVVFSGRWALNDILDTAASIGVCPTSAEYMFISNQLDRVVDVRANPGSGGAGVECDAMSVGVTFVGYPARFAGLIDTPPLPNLCAGM